MPGDLIASFLMLIIGSAIIILWFTDLNNNPEIDLSEGLFRARDRDSGNILWFHLLAEFITGLLLITGAITLLFGIKELRLLVFLADGALFYSSLNSLGWSFAYRSRYKYVSPMLVGLVSSLIIPVLINL